MQGIRDESGAQAVEFILVLPLLLMLLFGTITGGMLYNQQLTLTQAAREGARFAATLPVDGDYQTRVISRIEDVSGGMLDASEPSHTVTVTEPDSEGRLVVRVTRPGRLEIIVNSWDLMVGAESVARHETAG
jgi:Flp pilus assembly protein TadG